MPLYRVTLAYDGTGYQGWQVQSGAPTVQGHVEAALARLAKTPVAVVGASRTDAGVHAHGQVAHFRLEHPILPEGLLRGLNAILPRDVRCVEAAVAEENFHARRSATSKTYRYFLDTRPVPSPFRIRFALHYPYPLDRGALAEGARLLVGTKDFAAFRASSCEAKTTLREVTASRFFENEGELVYEVAASGFLHHMVRNFVGTLLEVGRGKREPRHVEELLASKDRKQAGPTAPPRGLHLVRVDYR